ncbi:scavenger receptor cysteine rich domain containing [Cichlidogyrus casuarinus]|uniref:Scavenger receptor cysteine rich domain containing n=1 Tax=Cichlidogyrus casuarinus TaxID=1844966 RepID=A0ABD2PXE8_9PLAT
MQLAAICMIGLLPCSVVGAKGTRDVSGGWGPWSEYSECSVTCGVGVKSRTRQCNKPKPRGFGAICAGFNTEQVRCDTSTKCPIHGQWCAWGNFPDTCSDDCGRLGRGLWTRMCGCPEAQFGGSDCKSNQEIVQMAEKLQSVVSTLPADMDRVERKRFPDVSLIQMIREGRGKWDKCNQNACPYVKILTDVEQFFVAQSIARMLPYNKWPQSAGALEPEKNSPIVLVCPETMPAMERIFLKSGRFPQMDSFWTKTPPSREQMTSSKPERILQNDKNYHISHNRLIILSFQPILHTGM